MQAYRDTMTFRAPGDPGYDSVEPDVWFYDAGAADTVVVLPGFWRHRRYASMVGLGGLLNGAGYNAAIVDLRGHGESGGRFGFNRDEWCDIDLLLRVLRERHSVARCGYG